MECTLRNAKQNIIAENPCRKEVYLIANVNMSIIGVANFVISELHNVLTFVCMFAGTPYIQWEKKTISSISCGVLENMFPEK